MKILIAPDSFKGTLTAYEAAQAIAQGVKRALPQAQLQLLPLADGGEGTLETVLHACQGKRFSTGVSDAGGSIVSVPYAVIERSGTKIAVLEVAQVVGWHQAPSKVMQRTTYGLGELFVHCLNQGLRHFWIGLGGSSTNEGGLGLLQALGARCYDAQQQLVAPTPFGLLTLDRIDWDDLDPRLQESQITLLADVDNPLTGEQGATWVFGPQKGLTPAEIPNLERAMLRLAQLGDAWAGRAISKQAGAGAAGGLGYALMLCGAVFRSGAEAICELVGLDAALLRSDWVITGEGRSDAQTLHGKLPWVVAQHAQRAGVQAALLAGSIEEESRARLRVRFARCASLVEGNTTAQQAMQEPARYLTQRAHDMMKN